MYLCTRFEGRTAVRPGAWESAGAKTETGNVKIEKKICKNQKLFLTLQSFSAGPKSATEIIERFTIDKNKSSTRANKRNSSQFFNTLNRRRVQCQRSQILENSKIVSVTCESKTTYIKISLANETLKKKKKQDKQQRRVWSWLRMNASDRLNTCKSRGSGGEASALPAGDRRTGE